MSRRPVKGEYIETDAGNKVSRKANLVGTQNIILGGKSIIQQDVMIRGDLVRTLPPSTSSGPVSNTAVSIGRYCFMSRGSCLRPPGRMWKEYVFFFCFLLFLILLYSSFPNIPAAPTELH